MGKVLALWGDVVWCGACAVQCGAAKRGALRCGAGRGPFFESFAGHALEVRLADVHVCTASPKDKVGKYKCGIPLELSG